MEDESEKNKIALIKFIGDRKMTEHELTDEIKKELLGLAPFSSESQFEFTPKACKAPTSKIPEAFRPVYLLSCFTIAERKDVSAQLRKATDLSYEDIKALVKKKIHGFSRIFDIGSGQEIDFAPDADGTISSAQLSVLPKIVVEEIFYYIIQASGLMDTEKLGLR